MKRKRPATLEPYFESLVMVAFLHVALASVGWWLWHEHVGRLDTARKTTLLWMSPGDFKGLNPPPSILPKPVLASKTTAQAPVKPLQPAEPAPKAMLVAAPPDQNRLEPAPHDPSTPLFASVSPPPKPAANRSITLRRLREKVAMPMTASGNPAPPISSPTLLDIARLNRMRPPPVTVSADILKKGVPEDDAALDGVDEALNAAFLAAWTAPTISDVPPGAREARLNVSIGKDGTIVRAQMVRFSRSHVLDQSILKAAAQVKKISATLPSNFTKESYDLELNFLLLP